jgi:hypothetical protein
MLVFCVITVKAVLILERGQRIRLNHKNEALFVKCDVLSGIIYWDIIIIYGHVTPPLIYVSYYYIL